MVPIAQCVTKSAQMERFVAVTGGAREPEHEREMANAHVTAATRENSVIRVTSTITFRTRTKTNCCATSVTPLVKAIALEQDRKGVQPVSQGTAWTLKMAVQTLTNVIPYLHPDTMHPKAQAMPVPPTSFASILRARISACPATVPARVVTAMAQILV